MLNTTVEIINRRGLHARAAAKLAAVSAQFNSAIKIGFTGNMADGKNIMSLMMLAASQGSILAIEVEGTDESQALSSICQLIANRFEEDE